MQSAKILIMMPMKHGDPTQHTFKWAQKAAKLATDFGYNVKTIEKEINNQTHKSLNCDERINNGHRSNKKSHQR